MIKPDDWVSPHFRAHEVWCPCGCGMIPKAPILNAAEILRADCGGYALFCNSGARCADYNATLRFCVHCAANSREMICPTCGRHTVQRSAKNSQHMFGNAMDVRSRVHPPHVIYAQATKIAALYNGGLGKYRTFVHIDTGPGPRRW